MRPFRQPWSRQPQFAVEVDRSNPLTAGLEVLVPFHPGWGMRDLVSGAAVTKTGLAAGSAVTISGGQLLPLFGTSNYADLQQPARITSGTQPVTIAWVQEPRSPSGYNTVLNWKPTGATNAFAIYQATSDAAYYFVVGSRSGPGQILFGSIGATTSNALDVYVLICLGGLASTTGADYRLYRNGVAIAQSGIATFGANSAASFRVGALDSGGDTFEGAIGDLHIWSRALNDAEARSWTQNRFQTLKPAANRSVFLASASSGGSFSDSLTESASAAEALAASMAAAAATAESATATEATNATRAGAAAVAESASSASSQAAALAAIAALTEPASPQDTSESVLAAVAAVSEAATSTDLANWAGGAVSGSLTEAASASDACGATVIRAGALVEAAAATESVLGEWAGSAVLTEASTAIDAATGLLVTFTALTEATSAADAISVSDADADELYPLAGQTQTYPMTGATSYPLAGQSQTYPLGN